MPNLFMGIKKMSEEELRTQIAILKKVTFGNAVKETGFKAIGMLVDVANAFTSLVSDNVKIEYKITGVAGEVKEEATQLAGLSRGELFKQLRQQMIQKCNELRPNCVNEASSDDLISNIVIEEAARTYGLVRFMTPARKAENTSLKYNEIFLERLHKILVKEDGDDLQNTDLSIQKLLNEVSIEQKRELYKNVMPKDFSGKGFGRILRLERGTKYLKQVDEIIGTGFYDCVVVDIYAVYDMMMSANRIQRALFAQLIYHALKPYTNKFTVARDLLPGYISVDRREEESLKEKEFLSLLMKKEELEHNIENVNASIEKNQTALWENEEKLSETIKAMEDLQQDYDHLSEKKDIYVQGSLKTQDEIKQYNRDVNAAEKKLNAAKAAYDKSVGKIDLEKEEIAKKCALSVTYEQEYAAVKMDAELLVAAYAGEIKKVWSAFYYKFVFSGNVFELLITDFLRDEILNIEEYLKEMHDSTDIEAYGISFMGSDENQYFRAICNVSHGKNAYIIYRGKEIFKISRKEEGM